MRACQCRWILVFFAAIASAASAPLRYPSTPEIAVVEQYHGTAITDPWRWLEDPASEATRQWVRTQNELAQPWLERLPQRAWLKQRLTTLWNYERFGIPREYGGKYFFTRNDGTQNQSVLYVADAVDATPRVLFDPNKASGDATVALARFQPSPDGKILAYSLSDGGTDWEIWRFRRVADGSDLPDELRHTKFWSLSWARDGSGVWYSRYPQRADGKADDQAQPTVRFHRLGEPQDRDALIFSVTDHPARAPEATLTEDGRYLIIGLFDGYRSNGVKLLDMRQSGATPRDLFADWDALYTVLGSAGDTFYVWTTQAAPNGRVIAVDANSPQRSAWREVVAASPLAIEEASYIGGRIVVRYVQDARGLARIFTLDGKAVGDVPMPGPGSLAGFSGHGDRSETFFAFTDYLQPAQIFQLNVANNESRVWRAPRLATKTSLYATVQRFYTSKDGTRVPMFITQKRGAKRNGDQPVMLYGYGGFNVSLTPAFKPPVLAWLEMGGTYVEANLRGGGEYGEPWHVAGTLLQKQNVFDDFIAAAEFLVRERYTRPGRIAIMGRSNGGLLVGAALTQRPDLFGAALPAVGVLDMLRYHTASANARQWSSDYGLSENPEQFAAQLKYSPVHNTRRGTCYPPTLVTTADRDDRVVPWHSYKFGAALQRDQACANPVLVRVETRAGHGAGKPQWMQIEDWADQLAFAAQAIGMRAPRR
jgi:prolyl oligopeptidase